MQIQRLMMAIVSVPTIGGIITGTRCLFKSPDVQITKETRQTEEHGKAYYNHPLRKFCMNSPYNPVRKFYVGSNNGIRKED